MLTTINELNNTVTSLHNLYTSIDKLTIEDKFTLIKIQYMLSNDIITNELICEKHLPIALFKCLQRNNITSSHQLMDTFVNSNPAKYNGIGLNHLVCLKEYICSVYDDN